MARPGVSAVEQNSLVAQTQKMEAQLATAETHLNNITSQIQNFKAENFTQFLQDMAGGLRSLDIAYSELFGWTGEVADNADDVFVRREAALANGIRTIRDLTDEQKTELQDTLRALVQDAPVTYEEFTELISAAANQGVPFEDLAEFARVMAQIQTATDVAGGEGAKTLARLLNLTNESYSDLYRVGSVLDALGNNMAASQYEILDMAIRAAPALQQVGMSSTDILAVSAALRALGIQSAAGGTSIGKLGDKMEKAATLGAEARDTLMDWASASGLAAESIYELYMAADQDKDFWKNLGADLGMTASDAQALAKSALALENFSRVLGVTQEEFAAGWKADAAQEMLNLFTALGNLDGSGLEENTLWVLQQLDLTEVRTARAVKAMSSQWDQYDRALALARQEAQEPVTLAAEAERMYATTEARRQMNQNRAENMAESMGRQVTAMRQPFADFFAELQQWYADWPVWAQDAVSTTTEILRVGGQAIHTAADAAFAFNQLNTAYRQIQGMDTSRLTSGLATMSKVGLGLAAGVGVGYSLYEYFSTLERMRKDVTEISQTLSTLTIEIDEESKDAALRSLREVKDAANALGGGKSEEARQNAELAKMGFGTLSMFGSGVGYQMAVRDQLAEDAWNAYYREMGDLSQAMRDAATDTDRAAIQASMAEADARMQAAIRQITDDYTAEINAMANGMLGSAADAEQQARLERITKLYNALAQFSTYDRGSADFTQESRQLRMQYAAWARDLGLMREDEYRDVAWNTGSERSRQWDFSDYVKPLYEQLAAELAAVAGDEGLMTLLGLMTDSGALAGVDPTELDGALLALIQAMDIKAIGDEGAKNTQDVGKALTDGLARGLSDNQATATAAARDLAAAVDQMLRSTLQVHSPSALTVEMGRHVAQGLALGIAQNSGLAVEAVRALGAQVAAEARNQAALIENALQVIMPLPASASAGNTYNQSRSYHQTFNLQTGPLEQQQNVRELARQLTAMQNKADRALGN